MPRKVKCRFCGKQIDLNQAFKVKHGKTNWYYCSYEHSIMKSDRELFYQEAYDVLGQITNSLFFKEMETISQIYGYKKMKMYLIDNKDKFNVFNYKHFNSQFAKIKYFSAILKNNLGDYTLPKETIKRRASTEIYDTKNKEINLNIGFDTLLDEILK